MLYRPVRLMYHVFQNMERRNSDLKVKASSLVVNSHKSLTMLIVNLNTSVYSTEHMKMYMCFGG